MNNQQQKVANGLKLTAQIIASITAVFFVAFLVAEIISNMVYEGQEPFEIAGLILGLLQLLALAGAILAWWRERIASLILCLASLGLGIHIAIYAGRNHFITWLMLGSPYLIAGSLLFISWWLTIANERKLRANFKV